uniref:Sulfotransferase domain-containing protein n=1 Tax=Phaeomonas parva TaxID=124430 RepID=A0A7S1TUF3_9STRA|mmetsp:Transcript_18284/g.55865  ORF Transcript_18284/g.55865 Transcript_18284/m.55865 type:complete len:434 (+) Transcript_18284:315-1616(+)|eukprot:CAMPEP_0118874474 /NCGR_PEP_ID=MMETSP1163-20130328/15901_1 /TAXON_ID=124430 /ORGANISM="Phaeomonas parva, Strain CCMP2877" /LENGTH=433 /DNA_ID=CAMNT_0006809865 /DNA_START=54 /DNA_END=1355 /DNA_ORIENTATION=+
MKSLAILAACLGAIVAYLVANQDALAFLGIATPPVAPHSSDSTGANASAGSHLLTLQVSPEPDATAAPIAVVTANSGAAPATNDGLDHEVTSVDLEHRGEADEHGAEELDGVEVAENDDRADDGVVSEQGLQELDTPAPADDEGSSPQEGAQQEETQGEGFDVDAGVDADAAAEAEAEAEETPQPAEDSVTGSASLELAESDVVIAGAFEADTILFRAALAHLLATARQHACFDFVTMSDSHASRNGTDCARIVSTTLPFESIAASDNVKFVYVGRDGRDSFTAHLTQNDTAPKPAASFPDHFGEGMDRAVPEMFRRVQSYWGALASSRNVLFVHHNELLRDVAAALERVAAFLGVPAPRDALAQLREACTPGAGKLFSCGLLEEGVNANIIINGRWKDTLSIDQLIEWDKKLSEMPAGLARWLEFGRLPASA